MFIYLSENNCKIIMIFIKNIKINEREIKRLIISKYVITYSIIENILHKWNSKIKHCKKIYNRIQKIMISKRWIHYKKNVHHMQKR